MSERERYQHLFLFVMYQIRIGCVCVIWALFLAYEHVGLKPESKDPRLSGQILGLTDRRWDRCADRKTPPDGSGENPVSRITSLPIEWSLFVLYVQMKTVSPKTQNLPSFVFSLAEAFAEWRLQAIKHGPRGFRSQEQLCFWLVCRQINKHTTVAENERLFFVVIYSFNANK